MNLNREVTRTAVATGVSERTINMIRKEQDCLDWEYESGQSVQVDQQSKVPPALAGLVRQIIRDMFLEMEQQPKVTSIYQRLQQVKVQELEHLHLFLGPDIPTAESKV